jgi:hypothetical protein
MNADAHRSIAFHYGNNILRYHETGKSPYTEVPFNFFSFGVGGGLSDTAGVLQLAPKPPHLLHLWGPPQVPYKQCSGFRVMY